MRPLIAQPGGGISFVEKRRYNSKRIGYKKIFS
jgi:hypothetical protein